MNNNMSSDEQIQHIYNKTKNLTSPANLDSIILGKIRELEQQPESASTEKIWFYLPIAASILIVIFLQFRDTDITENPVEIAKSASNNKPLAIQDNSNRKQLPEIFYLPQEDITNKIVPACNGELVVPEGILDKLTEPTKSKSSNLPVKPIYPNNTTKKSPTCDRVSNQVFKK